MTRDEFAERLGRPDLARRDEGASGFSCPECQGNLWELTDGLLVQYQYRVGHVLSADSVVTQQAAAIETMLWTALNACRNARPCCGGWSTATPRTMRAKPTTGYARRTPRSGMPSWCGGRSKAPFEPKIDHGS
jgi:hypothetical protein